MREAAGTDLDMIDLNLADALAQIDSEEASNFGLHVRPMPRIWRLALCEEYVRTN